MINEGISPRKKNSSCPNPFWESTFFSFLHSLWINTQWILEKRWTVSSIVPAGICQQLKNLIWKVFRCILSNIVIISAFYKIGMNVAHVSKLHLTKSDHTRFDHLSPETYAKHCVGAKVFDLWLGALVIASFNLLWLQNVIVIYIGNFCTIKYQNHV